MPKPSLPAAPAGLPSATSRKAIECAVARLIDVLDRLDADADREASLGWPAGYVDPAGLSPEVLAAVDAELDEAEDEDDPSGLEPSLGSTGPGWGGASDSQEFWSQGDHRRASVDAEEDDSDFEAEPDEDSISAPVGDGDQDRWAQGAAGDVEATGTLDDIAFHSSRTAADRIALAEAERQVRALARRLRCRADPSGRRADSLVGGEQDGNISLLCL